MTKELDGTQDADLEGQLDYEISMAIYGRPPQELSALEGLKHIRLMQKLLPRLVHFVRIQRGENSNHGK
jgi:hypothetical protein